MTRRGGADLPPEERVVGPGFHERVYAVVRTVPRGRVTTYGAVAAALGSPRVARQVGWALAGLTPERAAPSGDDAVPWHRVINAGGAISHRGDLLRAEEQRARLEAEGVSFREAGTCDLGRFLHVPEPLD